MLSICEMYYPRVIGVSHAYVIIASKPTGPRSPLCPSLEKGREPITSFETEAIGRIMRLMRIIR